MIFSIPLIHSRACNPVAMTLLVAEVVNMFRPPGSQLYEVARGTVL
jgi:hypothetical protein